VPVIFLEAVSKWKGYEPVRSFHSAGIPKDRLSDWDAAYSAAEKAFAEKDYVSALGLYARCVEIDPDYALAHYRMGQCYESLGDPQKANGSYAAANDLDRYLIRAPSTVNRFYDSLAASAPGRVFVIKTRELFERSSPAGVIGDELIGDQIHPTIDGQALMALEIVRTIYGSGLLAPKLRWRWDRLRSVGEMKRSLKVDAHAEVEMELALAGYVQRDYPKAAQFLEKAYALRPDSVFISSWLAWVYWKLGDRDKSIALYRRLAHDAPALSSAFFSRHPDIRSAL
jgi:tetratricopeptide (TPR) repeat protein